MNRTDKIRRIRQGDVQDPGDVEHPLFWTYENGFYVAGDYKLTLAEFEMVNRRQPCFLPPVWIKKDANTYVAGNMTLRAAEYEKLSPLLKQRPVITFKKTDID